MNVETHHPYDPATQMAFSRQLNARLYSPLTRIAATGILMLVTLLPFGALFAWRIAQGGAPALAEIVAAAGVAVVLRIYVGRQVNLYFMRKLSSVVTLQGADVHYRFDDAGVHGAMAYSTWSVAWAGVDRLIATKKGIMFVISIGAYFVPASAFSGAGGLSAFAAEALSKLAPAARERSLIQV